MNKYIIVFLLACACLSACKTKQIVQAIDATPQLEEVRTLCGTFVASDSSALLNRIDLRYWNVFDATTPYDDMLPSMLEESEYANITKVRPASRYFISSDTLYLEMDKGYLTYTIEDENTLLGAGFWNKDTKLERIEDKSSNCPKTHRLSEEDKNWLRHSRMYYSAYYSQNWDAAEQKLELLCTENYGPACMTLSSFKLLEDEAMAIGLLEKACDLGYFGHYACYKFGELLERKEKMEAAKTAYQKACDGGHLVGCFGIYLLEAEVENSKN